MSFLPINRQEMEALGWDRPDFLYVIGDAYVDHPSFGPAIISRVLEHEGYRVAILSQPDWTSKQPFLEFGRPRLGVLVSSGNIDSMVNHYTAAKKKRSSDAYTPGGKAGKRPDRAVIVYCDRVRRSVLIDARADLISYGMGERSIAAIANQLNQGKRVKEIRNVDGTVYCCSAEEELPPDTVVLPSFEQVRDSKRAYADSVRIQYEQQDHIRGKRMAQGHQNRYVVQNKPAAPLTTE